MQKNALKHTKFFNTPTLDAHAQTIHRTHTHVSLGHLSVFGMIPMIVGFCCTLQPVTRKASLLVFPERDKEQTH
jgi:hypothetical protein